MPDPKKEQEKAGVNPGGGDQSQETKEGKLASKERIFPRRENLCSRLQTLYKLVQETVSKRDIAPPEERSRLQLVADGHFREFCPTFGRLYDLVNKPLQKLLLTELQGPFAFELLTANDRLKNPLRSVGCFLSDSVGFFPLGNRPLESARPSVFRRRSATLLFESHAGFRVLPKCFQEEKLGQFRRFGVNADREYSEAHRDHPF